MEESEKNRRKDERLGVAVGANVTLRGWPLLEPAVTVNSSSTGVLLQFACPVDLEIGQIVTCDYKAFDQKGEISATPSWSQGKVVRIEGNRVALQFMCATFGDADGDLGGEQGGDPDAESRRDAA